MVDFLLKAGLIILATYFYLHIISIWVDALMPIDPEYEYCYGCKNGFCTETPKSSKCDKWRQEHENNDK